MFKRKKNVSRVALEVFLLQVFAFETVSKDFFPVPSKGCEARILSSTNAHVGLLTLMSESEAAAPPTPPSPPVGHSALSLVEALLFNSAVPMCCLKRGMKQGGRDGGYTEDNAYYCTPTRRMC